MIINPIFIIGNPRLGTSLLRVILNAHPNLVIPPECGFAMWLYPQFKNIRIVVEKLHTKKLTFEQKYPIEINIKL